MVFTRNGAVTDGPMRTHATSQNAAIANNVVRGKGKKTFSYES